MNYQIVARMLSTVTTLIGTTMLFSLPWAHPKLGYREGLPTPDAIEWRGFWALLGSTAICFIVGAILRRAGRHAKGRWRWSA